jgi:hypothetical protein
LSQRRGKKYPLPLASGESLYAASPHGKDAAFVHDILDDPRLLRAATSKRPTVGKPSESDDFFDLQR